MTNKEIGELRRRMKPDRTNLTAVYGCYVASSGEVLSTFREPFGLMAEEDKEKYLAIFRRALSGTPDKNLIDLSFTTKQVADSDEHRLLMRLRETALDDEEARQKLFQTMIGAAEMTLSTGKHPGLLQSEVCSPAGTTIEGVRALEQHGVRAAAIDAVTAAYTRTLELAKH